MLQQRGCVLSSYISIGVSKIHLLTSVYSIRFASSNEYHELPSSKVWGGRVYLSCLMCYHFRVVKKLLFLIFGYEIWLQEHCGFFNELSCNKSNSSTPILRRSVRPFGNIVSRIKISLLCADHNATQWFARPACLTNPKISIFDMVWLLMLIEIKSFGLHIGVNSGVMKKMRD